jgi:hypothetical protein
MGPSQQPAAASRNSANWARNRAQPHLDLTVAACILQLQFEDSRKMRQNFRQMHVRRGRRRRARTVLPVLEPEDCKCERKIDMRNKLMIGLAGSFVAAMAPQAGEPTNGVTNETQPAVTNAPTLTNMPVPALTNAPMLALANAPPAFNLNTPGSFGLGATLGEPLGVNGKLWLSEKTAVDAGVGWSFGDQDGVQVHADFLYHKFDLFQVSSGQMPLYFGIGGRVKFVDRGDNRAGIRGPVGISYLFPNSRWEVFGEVAPILDLAPKTSLEWNGGIGFRYYFGR